MAAFILSETPQPPRARTFTVEFTLQNLFNSFLCISQIPSLIFKFFVSTFRLSYARIRQHVLFFFRQSLCQITQTRCHRFILCLVPPSGHAASITLTTQRLIIVCCHQEQVPRAQVLSRQWTCHTRRKKTGLTFCAMVVKCPGHQITNLSV